MLASLSSEGRAALLDAARVEQARRRLMEFVLYTYADYKAGWFHRLLCARLDAFLTQVVAQMSPRLMVFAPPRSGKSEVVSRRFPAFALGRHPDLSVIATSYAADLASSMNRDVQRVIESPEYGRIFPGTQLFGSNVRTTALGTWLRNSDIFEVVGHKGVYKSAGVGGGITGRGGHILIVDDPIKDAEQADSPVYRQKVDDWFTSTLYTRQAPGAGVLIILTRWHHDDLAGRLLERARTGEGEQWDVISFPAIAEADEEHRKEGEALHPERYSVADLQRIKAAVGTRVWTSLYQQRPTVEGGGILKLENWRWYEAPEAHDVPSLLKHLGISSVVQAWDTGFKAKEQSDPSVGVTLGIAENAYYLLDLYRAQLEYPELKRMVVALHAKWRPQALLVEDAASGQSLIQELRRDTRLPVLGIRPDRDKVARANAVTPVLEAGLVKLPKGAAWTADFLSECVAFPNGKHDDQVDAFTMALGYCTGGGGGLGVWEWYKKEAAKAMVARKGGE